MAVSIHEYEKALNALQEALQKLDMSNDDSYYKIIRDACIQRFEFCIELAWKTSKKILGSSSTTAKPVMREMAQNGLIQSPDLWFAFIEARNKSSHTYDEDLAKEVLKSVKEFLPEGKKLLEVLKTK